MTTDSMNASQCSGLDELTADDLHSLASMAEAVLANVCTPERLADPTTTAHEVWKALDKVGVTRLGLAESGGGHGGGLLAATEVLRVIGENAAPGPLAETSLLAGWLLEVAGRVQPEGPVTTGRSDLVATREDGAWQVRGTVYRVPTAPGATIVATARDVADAELLVVFGAKDHERVEGRSLAQEPRDTITAHGPVAAVHPLPAGTIDELRLRGALSRAALTAGALVRVRDRTLVYAGEREQFGRPLSAFQAVQHQLAHLVAESAAAGAAVDQAVRAALQHGFSEQHTALLVAAAKVRSAQAASTGAAIAHQIHAALGMTEEHPLHHHTTRLWSWRSEWGSEAEWSAAVASAATDAGSTGLWPLLTGIR
ncbi:acyl-CoA dehydrogenase family protein [Nocardioides massiliensis]|uniref:Acyl-CoA dehydrogenase n=1 Tax=Nocardioides massiliensis TaxID=1325935 RepID=A0ABT9NKB4_9ACTN|nr:acyl-CoA dehydrogenase [Nocardioides massiliensis]MDP9820786.1 acyl-CoA dehydrogenase [Nocardioides massiliensis]